MPSASPQEVAYLGTAVDAGASAVAVAGGIGACCVVAANGGVWGRAGAVYP